MEMNVFSRRKGEGCGRPITLVFVIVTAMLTLASCCTVQATEPCKPDPSKPEVLVNVPKGGLVILVVPNSETHNWEIERIVGFPNAETGDPEDPKQVEQLRPWKASRLDAKNPWSATGITNIIPYTAVEMTSSPGRICVIGGQERWCP
jgi:hypothetical protein